MTRSERAAEQDAAAGSAEVRRIPTSGPEAATASVALRMPRPGRRIYAYLRWGHGSRTIERYIGEVTGTNRAELLADAWRQVRERELIPRNEKQSETANSWATTPAVRSVMRANPRRDTKPERRLRSLLHGMGLRYRVDRAPLPGIRRRADLVFPRAKVVVFVDGCFWHGCPQHYRPARKNAEFWDAKLLENTARDRETDQLLSASGWRVIRVWEHEDMPDAAERIYCELRARVR